jgi:hypothetical protein
MRARITAATRCLSDSRAEKVGFSRFFHNEKVTTGEMLEVAAGKTAEAALGRQVLLIEDTTEINYAAKAGRKRNLGTVGNGSDVGLFVHPAMAVDAQDGSVLGLAGAKIWRRTKKKAKNYQSLPIEEKESYRWLETSRAGAAALKAAASITEIKDREGDIYEVFARERAPNVKLLVRATHDRALADNGRLFARVSAQNEAGRPSVALPARLGRPARTASLAVRFAKTELRQPNNGADARDPKSVPVTIVEVREIDAPSEKDAIHWRLLTTHGIDNLADALRVVDFYRRRWTIEQLFRTLKSQAFDIEESFIEDGEALERLAAVTLIAATSVMQLVHARGDAGQHYPAHRIFTSDEIEFLHILIKSREGKTAKQKNPHPSQTLAWAAWCIARLGGWNGYSSERPPGPITFSRGLKQFHAMALGYALAKAT